MSPPLLQVNNFLQPKAIHIDKNIQIDKTSKIYVIIGLILGVNRISLINSSKKLFILMIFYYVVIHAIVFYKCIITSEYLTIIDAISVFIFTSLGGLYHTRLFNFYDDLNKFDKEIGLNKNGSRETQHYIYACFTTIGVCLLLHSTNPDNVMSPMFYIVSLLLLILQALELYYYGHLISLMIPRLKLITNYFKFSYPNSQQERDDISNRKFINNQKHQLKFTNIDLQKLIILYDKIIIIYDKLNSAVKWQMVFLLTMTFVQSLLISYLVLKALISGMTTTLDFVRLIFLFLFLAVELVPILVPCVFADRVCSEAFVLREILACRLYDNTIDKSSRSSARIMLTLIETRNLSFSLFHMINVDISLPFKFLALLLTYVVILLQFDKVINS